ncbi:hypothetical protein ACFOPQ_04205 [Deinococcus antarcticus]|uniref:Uncharacterized protein n=2 Tax=Deinococcus TaxID=1298 RepID=A0ABV8A2Q8_9DEIO
MVGTDLSPELLDQATMQAVERGLISAAQSRWLAKSFERKKRGE